MIHIVAYTRVAAELDGYTAFQNGKSLSDNPYPEIAIAFLNWQEGYMSAQNEKGLAYAEVQSSCEEFREIYENPYPLEDPPDYDWQAGWDAVY